MTSLGVCEYPPHRDSRLKKLAIMGGWQIRGEAWVVSVPVSDDVRGRTVKENPLRGCLAKPQLDSDP